MTLCPAGPLDAGPVGAILSDFVDRTDWMPRIHTRAEDIAHAGRMIDRGWVTVVRTGGRVRGFMARDGQWVHALYIASGSHGQGLGSRLLDSAKSASGRLELWTFQANAAARAFYARHGFAEVELTDGASNDEKLPDVRLIWERD